VTDIACKQVEHHHCYAPGCPRIIPPYAPMCKQHWSKVPQEIRHRVSSCYRPGQCERSYPNMGPTPAWVAAVREAIAAVEKQP